MAPGSPSPNTPSQCMQMARMSSRYILVSKPKEWQHRFCAYLKTDMFCKLSSFLPAETLKHYSEFCLLRLTVLCVIDTHVAKNQIAFTRNAIILASPNEPHIDIIVTSSPPPPPMPLYSLRITIDRLIPTNCNNLVFFGVRFNRDIIVWDAESGEVFLIIDHRDNSEWYMC